MPTKIDMLADLPRRKRFEREQDDLRFLTQSVPITRSSNPADVELVRRATGTDISSIPEANLDEPSVVVCMRVDLDHPLLMDDNKVGKCGDCGCDIQFRPDTPSQFIHLCICCAARRAREGLAEE